MGCDCFSLPNAAELVEQLRAEADAVQAIEWDIPICTSNHIKQAADAIEQLLQENEKLKSAFDEAYAANEDLFAKLEAVKAERDAAVADLKYSRVCYTCKHKRTTVCDGCHVNLDKWEWRGAK